MLSMRSAPFHLQPEAPTRALTVGLLDVLKLDPSKLLEMLQVAARTREQGVAPVFHRACFFCGWKMLSPVHDQQR